IACPRVAPPRERREGAPPERRLEQSSARDRPKRSGRFARVKAEPSPLLSIREASPLAAPTHPSASELPPVDAVELVLPPTPLADGPDDFVRSVLLDVMARALEDDRAVIREDLLPASPLGFAKGEVARRPHE